MNGRVVDYESINLSPVLSLQKMVAEAGEGGPRRGVRFQPVTFVLVHIQHISHNLILLLPSPFLLKFNPKTNPYKAYLLELPHIYPNQ
jgi:hypothetical protein